MVDQPTEGLGGEAQGETLRPKRICPFRMTLYPKDVECLGDKCAWWVRIDDVCAVLSIGAYVACLTVHSY